MQLKMGAGFQVFNFVIAFVILSCVASLSLKPVNFRQKVTTSNTRLFEDFNLDFSNPVIISSRELFSEKQLREFTATYSVDERGNFFEGIISFVTGIFKKKEETSETTTGASVAQNLKPTVSIAVLEEKSGLFVKGKIDAKAYYAVLNAAFGDKLGGVLPQIIANLPPSKAAELTKVSS